MTVPDSSRAGRTCITLTCVCVHLCYMLLQSSFQVDQYLCGRSPHSASLNDSMRSSIVRHPRTAAFIRHPLQSPGLKWMLNPSSAMSLLQHMWLRRNRDAMTECLDHSAEELKRLNVSLIPCEKKTHGWSWRLISDCCH